MDIGLLDTGHWTVGHWTLDIGHWTIGHFNQAKFMRTYLFLFCLFIASATSAKTSASQSAQVSRERIVLKAKKSLPKALRLGLFNPKKRYQEVDKLAIIAICLDGVTVVATLVTYLVWGGFAAGFALLFSSIFTFAGMVLAIVSLIRAAVKGWRRGTFWAVLALGIPLLFLLLTVLTG